MYYLQSLTDDIAYGDLYQFDKGIRVLKEKNFHFSKCDDIMIKGAIICQWLAEGQSLNVLDDPANKNLPTKYEFYLWIEENEKLNSMFQEAQRRRLLSLIEDMYEKLNNSKEDMDEKTIEKQTDALNRLTKYLKEFRTVPKSVVNTRVITFPFIAEKYDLQRSRS